MTVQITCGAGVAAKPKAGSLWLTKSGKVAEVRHIISVDAKEVVAYNYSDGDDADLIAHPMDTWPRGYPLQAASRERQGCVGIVSAYSDVAGGAN